MFITAVIITTYLQNGTKPDIKMKGHWITNACFKSDKQTGFYKVRTKEDTKHFLLSGIIAFQCETQL